MKGLCSGLLLSPHPVKSPFTQGGLVRHYKGGVYRLLCVAVESGKLQERVVYQDIYNNVVWVRPVIEFYGTNITGEPRFTVLEEETCKESEG